MSTQSKSTVKKAMKSPTRANRAKPATATQPVKVAKAGKKAPPKSDKGMSGLDAAARVLKEASAPLNCKAMVDAMLSKSYWKTGGKTPWATLYSAIIREIAEKKSASRFKKAGRGLFAINKEAAA